jgi:pyridoxal phosphate enzyme (YggS family)
MSIADRLAKIQDDIRTLAPGRNVTLVAVSKYATVAQMREAYACGVRHFGENKVQDALGKIVQFPPEQFPDLYWHFIGSLQTNKVNKTVGRFSLIQAVDSVRLAAALSKANMSQGVRQDILIQINISRDESRHGFMPDQAASVVAPLLALKGIHVRGLMAMAPSEASLSGNFGALRDVFGDVTALRDSLSEEFGIPLPELSMGMSHDYGPALESGATIIRIGNLLFQNEELAYNRQ